MKNLEIRSTLEHFTGNASAWDELFADEVNQRYSQIAGLFRVDLRDSDAFFTHKIPETAADGTRLATKGIGYSEEAVKGRDNQGQYRDEDIITYENVVR